MSDHRIGYDAERDLIRTTTTTDDYEPKHRKDDEK